MGILDAFRMTKYQEAITAGLATITDPSTLPIATPWSSGNMQRIVFEDIFGSTLPVNTRAAAMRLPAIARARNLICSTIGPWPLKAMKLGVPLEVQPSWLYATDTALSPQLRTVWTVDDLFFYGWSCWRRQNGAPSTGSFPLRAGRVAFGEWSINEDMRVEIGGQVVPDNEVILIQGIHEGILTFGRDALQDARDLYDIVRDRLRNPVPQINLHQVSGRELTDTEIDALIDRWAAARRGDNAGVGFTNKDINVDELGTSGDAQLMIEARNAAAVDLARVAGVSAGMLDATTPKASLNYETQTGRNEEFIDLDVDAYSNPIGWRLSLDDVVPSGTSVAFDQGQSTSLTPSTTGPVVED